MFIVYILKSPKYNKTYVGQTNDIVERFTKHNSKHTGWTNKYKPWYIAHLERYLDRSKALEKEKFLKTYTGRKEIQKILQKFD